MNHYEICRFASTLKTYRLFFRVEPIELQKKKKYKNVKIKSKNKVVVPRYPVNIPVYQQKQTKNFTKIKMKNKNELLRNCCPNYT